VHHSGLGDFKVLIFGVKTPILVEKIGKNIFSFFDQK